MRTSQKAAAYACAALIASGGLATGANAAQTGTSSEPTARNASTVCERYTGPYARCGSASKGRTQAAYVERGDKIDIVDRFRNGRSTKVVLHVKGSGKATFSSKGKARRIVDRNYTEGKKVRIMVCTSFSKKAKCSGWSGWGRT
ncbi:hypothetical protein E0L36_18950 [Streptomyces sp. AJS327]|uniref:hypothetical protein n=1 Tax=Streptomyces sp. AJS327 TaxID=2545265 RepID=UPI0015DEA267|nr:hypothetical protein [Streptomyces sp. AJS327]MBA0052874.1 hypothetical protein [Streptomyces sp. AJS327]